MLSKLKVALEFLPVLLEDPERWTSLIVNKRKPHTYRVSAIHGSMRVCLHRFEECGPDDAFRHPHPWPAAFCVLAGHYRQRIWASRSLTDEPEDDPLIDMILEPGSWYAIENPLTWHSIQPLEMAKIYPYPPSTFSVMVNSKPWDGGVAHVHAPAPAGEDLDRMTPDELERHLYTFSELLR